MTQLPIEIIDKIMLYNRTKEADIVLHAISKMVRLNWIGISEKGILPDRYPGYYIEEDYSCSDTFWVYSVFLKWMDTVLNQET